MDAESLSHSPSSLEADHEPLAKKLRKSLPPRKVCIICRGSTSEWIDESYIYIIDVSGESDSSLDDGLLIPKDPTIRLDHECPRVDIQSFCVLGSTLYMIEGCLWPKDNPGRKSVVTLDLSKYLSVNVSNKKLKKSELIEAPHMIDSKFQPYATPTPDDKSIVVFSSSIGFGPVAEADKKCDFELYDPVSLKWHKLPGICDNWGEDKRHSTFRMRNAYYFSIHVCTFMSKDVLVVFTDIGIFRLNLQLLDSVGWEEMDNFYGTRGIDRLVPRFFSFFLVIGDGDGLCLTPFSGFDARSSKFFPLREVPLCDYLVLLTRAITLIDDGKGECNFCVIQTEIDEDRDTNPSLIIDVYRCDPAEYKENKDREWGDSLPPGISIVKSFKFLLDVNAYSWLYPLYLFPIRGGTN